MSKVYFSQRYYNFLKKSDDEEINHSLLPNYFSKDRKSDDKYNREKFSGEFIEKCGIFRVEYYLENTEPLDTCCFSSFNFNNKNIVIATFYKNDQIIFRKENLSDKPCIILYGDGITENQTFFLIREESTLNIYNMLNEKIRIPNLTTDILLDVKRLNSKYAVSIGEDMHTGYRYTGLINLDILFSQNGTEKRIRPYDNSRVHVPIDWETYPDGVIYMPVSSNEVGFTVVNVKTKEVYPRIITYDEAFNEEFEFYDNSAEDEQMNMILNILNLKDVNKDDLSSYINEQIIEHGSICIK